MNLPPRAIACTVALLSLAALSATAHATTPPPVCEDDETTLFAGQHIDVGTLSINDDGSTLTVTYDVSDSDWTLVETHLYVGTEAPAKSAPGRFPYKHEGLDGAENDTYEVDLSDVGGVCDGELVVAAHAVVERFAGYADADLEAFNAALPDTATLVVAFPGGDSYFDSTVSGGTALDGSYDGYCVDTDRTISPGSSYTVNVLSSLDPDLAASGLVEMPENFDLVNYIINQDYTAQTCDAAGRAYTYGDIQRAIWGLVEDNQSTAGLGTWSQACADEITADAQAGGEGFSPECDEVVAVLLQPVNTDGATSAQVTIAQVTFAAVGVECEPLFDNETAWGFGDTQFRRGWGWMIDYPTCPCDDLGGGIE